MRYLPILLITLLLISVSCETRAEEAATVTSVMPTQPAEPKIPSEEQMAIWEEKSVQPLIQRWLAGEDLDGQFVELDWGSGSEWAGNQKVAKTALLDVDGDGGKELAYQTGCATVGNCLFYVYQRTRDSYRQILAADMVQKFELRKTKTKGFFDIETSAHDSAISGGIAVYKFDGTEYAISECFGYEYKVRGRIDRNGQSVVADKPTLTKADCSKWPSVETRR